MLKFWFLDRQHRLRNGWRSVGFFLVVALIVGPLLAALHAVPAEGRAYVPKGAILALGVLAASWICVRLEGGSLAGIGLRLNAQFATQTFTGLSSAIAVVLLVAGLVWLLGGFRLETSPNAPSNLLKAAAFEVGLAVMEELIYRGYAFQRAIRGLGVPAAQLVFAILFCASHPLDGGMSLSSSLCGVGNLFLLALIAGACYLRTGSLAVPIGAHAGWNWAQQALGFGVSGINSHGAWSPVFLGEPDWLTGGAFGLEASAVTVVVLACVAGMSVRRQGAMRAAAGGMGPGDLADEGASCAQSCSSLVEQTDQRSGSRREA